LLVRLEKPINPISAVQPSPAAEPTSALIVDVNEAATIFGSKKLEEVQVAADAI
jgi:hypothetical protein